VPRPESLAVLFRRIERPPLDSNRISGSRIPWRRSDFVARTTADEPVVLIAAEPGPGFPAIRLRHLEVDFGARCKIREQAGADTEGDFVSIQGRELSAELVDVFLTVMESLLAALPSQPHLPQVRQAVHDVSELFRALEVPARRDAQGLWAELFVIATRDHSTDWLRAWRITSSDKFDFTFGVVLVDVKSTQLPRRLHTFSLDQLSPPEGATAYVASVLVRPSASGPGVLGLAERIAAKVAESRDLVDKVWRNTVEALGRDFGELTDLRFDEAYAQQTLRFLPSELIPRPRQVDQGVTNVRFDADIDDVTHAAGMRRLPEAPS
jgi:hypothetical protein